MLSLLKGHKISKMLAMIRNNSLPKSKKMTGMILLGIARIIIDGHMLIRFVEARRKPAVYRSSKKVILSFLVGVNVLQNSLIHFCPKITETISENLISESLEESEIIENIMAWKESLVKCC